jgi:hypothetical protein
MTKRSIKDQVRPTTIQVLDQPPEDEQEQEQQGQSERKTPLYDHERKRRPRQMSVTFPTPEWSEVVREQAGDWGMRPSDFVTYCVAYTMAAIEQGEAQRPQGTPSHNLIPLRAGGTFDLPWEP